MDTPRGCPFCLRRAIRLLYGAADGVQSYRCQDCGRVFHTADVRASPEAYASLDQRGRVQKVH
jgi:transposase-like protein